MRLCTLGGLQLEGSDFRQPKPLLLLAYLCLEGAQERRHLAELFWPGGADPMGNLATVLARLKKVDKSLWEADDVRVWTALPCDALDLLTALEEGASKQALDLYQGRFLEGFYLKEVGTELEEWVYATRESIAGRVRSAQLSVAEEAAAQGDFSAAAKLAERAYLLSGASELGDEELKRLYRLLIARSSDLAEEVRKEAQSFGISLSLTVEEARQELADKAKRVTPHNLIPQPIPFVGRGAEIGALSKRLSDPHCRLLTIVGPGGIGKTRLTIEVAQGQLAAFQDGVYFVSFVAVSSPSLMAYAVSDALDLSLLGQEAPHLQLAHLLKDKTLLLVLDNLEHLLADLGLIHSLLAHAPKVKLFVTSREPLNLQAEHVFDLRGMDVPKQAVNIEAYDAVKLFLQSARQRRADFELDDTTAPAVSRICQLVGGMPLALELAASWLRALSPDEIANEIERGIDILQSSARDLPARHHSIRAVFDHSWRLLSEQEQAVLRRLAVFRGGFTREAAAEVAGASLAILAGLVDKSLLRTVPGGRYRRHPLVIQYAQERLAKHPEEKAQAEEKHGLYYLRLVQERAGDLRSLKKKETRTMLQEEIANISTAWRWAVEHERVEELKRNARAITDILGKRWQEGLELFTLAVSHLSDTNPNHQATLGYMLIRHVRQ
jgi:predicted ATPase